MEAIILAGGFGTRLQGVIGKYPKCMANICGKPFLSYLVRYLTFENCSRAIFSLGFRHDVVTEWLSKETFGFQVTTVVEEHPLGTGGAIKFALENAISDDVIILNGDTLFQVDLFRMMQYHKANKSETTIALKAMHNFDRYGVVNTFGDGQIESFTEKRYTESGYINGGAYIINKKAFLEKALPVKFSFESEYLEKFTGNGKFYGFKSDSYFIDIGIPADYERAQNEFKILFP